MASAQNIGNCNLSMLASMFFLLLTGNASFILFLSIQSCIHTLDAMDLMSLKCYNYELEKIFLDLQFTMFCVFDMCTYRYDKSILLPHHLELGNDERCSSLQFFHFLKNSCVQLSSSFRNNTLWSAFEFVCKLSRRGAFLTVCLFHTISKV